MGQHAGEILLRGGPADGEIHRDVPQSTQLYQRLAKHPDALYRDSAATDPEGRRVFQYSPPEGAGRNHSAETRYG